jgi:hypothetical protein
MSYDSASLTTRDIKWLGVRPTDLDAYSIPKEVGGERRLELGLGPQSFWIEFGRSKFTAH